MSHSTSVAPIQILIPPSINHLAVSLTDYLRAHPSYGSVAVGACIFTPSNDEVPRPDSPRLLLVQRAATERGFPNLWEVPGGGAEGTDPTILHSVAREVFEETGLKLTRFVCAVGDGCQFITGGSCKWNKLTFEIEVQQNHSTDASHDGPLPVTLDPTEHQAYKWVTEEDLSQWGPGKIVTEEQRQIMLLAFQQHKERAVRNT
ncbi:MAG: hypothetical protein Q9191_004899 [Dirinaria sp. TL-2023a]